MPIILNGTTGLTFNDLSTQNTGYAGAGMQVYTTAQTNTVFTIPSGVTKLKVTVIGAGGGGAGGTVSGGGGGGGATAIKFLSGLTPGNTLLVSVGGAGTAGSGGGGNGGTGGASSVASGSQIITAITATGGAGGSTSYTGGSGGTSTSGDLNIPGGRGRNAIGLDVGFCNTVFIFGDGGSSAYGASGAAATLQQGMNITSPNEGGFPGGGGGGGGYYGGNPGAAGAVGAVIIEWG